MDNNDRKTDFFNWLKSNRITSVHKKDVKTVITLLNSLDIPVKSIFSETDSLKIRLLCSEIVIKGDIADPIKLADQLTATRFLITYAGYLTPVSVKATVSENKTPEQVKHRTNSGKGTTKIRHDDDTLNDALTLTYYLSRLNRQALNNLGYKTWKQAFTDISTLFNMKIATIKNMRDEFDPYFDNGRAGWYQTPLSKTRQIIFNRYAETSDAELNLIVQEIINRQRQQQTSSIKHNDHKKIVIKNDAMKEVHTSKKRR